jgi:hypothetical protein
MSLVSVENITSDIPGVAPIISSHLRNPWGAAVDTISQPVFESFLLSWYQTESKIIWIANNKSGEIVAHLPSGQPTDLRLPVSSPTGVRVNSTRGFVLIDTLGKCAPASLICVTEEGRILGWNRLLDMDEMIVAHDAVMLGGDPETQRDVFKGLTLAETTVGP